MGYNGIEIFFQNLGDADSIFVRFWDSGHPTNILIDGGNKGDVEKVVEFLEDRVEETGEPTIHHLVCSHCHDDHAGGLLKLVQDYPEFPIGIGWVHDTRAHNQVLSVYRETMLKLFSARQLLHRVQKSEATRISLIQCLEGRKIPVYSPFAGQQIGPLIVLGPSADFFNSQFGKLENRETAATFEEAIRNQILFESTKSQFRLAAEDAIKELGGEPTSPENEVSTILAMVWDGEVHLFTADAGCEGLIAATNNPFSLDVEDVSWMQVPHHGSRRNMSEELIEFFRPTTSFISCAGTRKHPSRKLVNALKEKGGSSVYSTHYCNGGWIRRTRGQVPKLGTVSAIPLYEKE